MEQDTSENIDQFSEMTNDKCIVKSNLCRICAASVDRMCGIFSLEGHAKNLSHKINVYLPFKVTEQDILPLNCCYDCISILSAWHKFVLKSVDANNKLLEVFTKKSFIQNVVPKISNISPNSDSNRPCTEINPSSLLILGPDSKSTFDKNQCNTEKTNYSKSSEQQQFCNSEDNLEDLLNLKCEFGKIPKCFSDNNVSDVSDILLIELKEEVDTQTQFNKPENREILHHPNGVSSKSNSQQDQPVKLIDNIDAPKEEEVENKLKGKKNNRERRGKKDVKTKKKKMRDKFEEVEEEEEEDDPQELLNYYESSYSEEEMIIDHIRRAHPENKIPEKKSILSKLKRQKQKKLDHDALIASKVTVEGRVYYNCNICGKNLHSPYTFIWHRRIHSGEKPYVCDLCGKQFRVSQGLIRHLRETHEGVKNFGCDICGRMFATKRNVEEHRRIHTNERPYVCAHCGKAFRQKASLYVHNRSHSDTYPYKCTYCDLMFRSKPPMLVHITRHTGEKPYPCDVCGRRFRIKYELKKHALIHSDEKPYSCAECGTSFRQKRYLRNHNKINHNRKIN